MTTSGTKPAAGAGADRSSVPGSLSSHFVGHLLLVEDNDVSALIAKAELKRLGITIDHARDGIEALRLFESRHFDLVLMDCEMPLMDGYETTQRIRRLERTKETPKIPIVAFTANTLVGDRAAVLQMGMDDYVSKPLVPGALAQTLAKFLGSV